MIDEYNDKDFDILFHGTFLDYEDLVEVFKTAYTTRNLTAQIERKPAKETSDKEVLIEEVFREIQKGPFEELRGVDVENAFKHAKSRDFEVCVVATMSAGKSTLINSLIGKKLMPSRQEACTAIITRLKDNDSSCWNAEVYGKNGERLEKDDVLDYSIMERLNSDKRVSEIRASGNIPFVTSEDVSLVLIDTPGPNNSRDPEHRRIQNEFLSKSSKSLILYIMEGTFGSDDDNALLDQVAESMSVGGKQSKDRFLFVINKMDDRKKEDGDTEQTLKRLRTYLEAHNIKNPNIFPMAALPALNIRLIASGDGVDEDTFDETELKVKKLNRNQSLHLEEYATLPSSIRKSIEKKLETAIINGNTEEQALIHTGVVSLEAAIRQYVQKYAKTAKIKNIVDTFRHKLDEVGCFEETKKELALRQDESEKIVRKINAIQMKLDDGEIAKKYKEAVEQAIVQFHNDSRDSINNIIVKLDERIRQKIDEARGKKLAIEEVDAEVEVLGGFTKKLEPEFQADLEILIREKLIDMGNTLLKEYERKLSSLTEEIDMQSCSEIKIDPLSIMIGSVKYKQNFQFHDFIHLEQVEDGEDYVKNTDKKWYKPWTWFMEKGYYRTRYKNVQYVEASELAQAFFGPIQRDIVENGNKAREYAINQSKRIAVRFDEEFAKLDMVLKSKLAELESYACDKTQIEKRILESEYKLRWLDYIRTKIEEILEI